MWGKWNALRYSRNEAVSRAAHPAGRDLFAPPEDTLAILVVCTANMCRSPLVAAVLQQELDFAGVRAVVNSAGVHAIPGSPYDDRIERLLRELGLRPDAPGPRPLSNLILSTLGRDLVVVMTAEHLREVASIEPAALPRTFQLGTLACLTPEPTWWQALDRHHAERDLGELLTCQHPSDVPDPYGKQGHAFVRAIDDLTAMTLASARFIGFDGAATS